MQWKLIRLRKEHKLSQKEMAKMLDLTSDGYGLKERGQNQFTMDEMFVLSRYFGLRMDDIFLSRNLGNTEVSGN